MKNVTIPGAARLLALAVLLISPLSALTQPPAPPADSTLLGDAARQGEFWQRIETDPTFKKDLSAKLALQAYRKIGQTVPAVRVSVLSGHALETPSIILEYQTAFHGTIEVQGGPFGGDCVQVFGGRDAYAHRTFFGGTEDPKARQEFLDLFEQRKKMPSNRRKDLTPKFDELFAKYIPGPSVDQVKTELIDLLKNYVRKNEAAGAAVLPDSPLGEFGVKLNEHLYAYVRDFGKGSVGSRAAVTDPYFWLILSGGPKPMPEGYLPAFPGAEGFGAQTTGGRGGKVIHVTNTNASGPGSFVEAIQTPGPRTVLFDVSGQIVLEKDVWIDQSDLTLIGYTAPGEGIEICGRLCMKAENVIMRGMRWRLRPPLSADGSNTSGDLHNIIFDHCSFAYGSDEALRFIGETHTFWNYTLQHCIIGPGMTGLGTHPYGPEIGGAGSIHHCILNNTLSRSPEVDCSRLDWRNNILFNLRSGHSKRLTSQFNFVNNLVIDNPGQPYVYGFGATANNYIAGNMRYEDGKLEPFGPGSAKGAKKSEDTDGDFAADPSDLVKAPWRVVPVVTHEAKELEAVILPVVGASLPRRDTTDLYAIEGIVSRKGKPFFWADSKNWSSYNKGSNDKDAFNRWESASFPPPASGAKPAADSDRDGMPDAWESAHGLDPKDAADGPADADKDGYTNLEEFLYRTDPRVKIDYTKPENNRDSVFTAAVAK